MCPTIADPTGLNYLGLSAAFNADGRLTLDTEALGYGSVAHCSFSCQDLPLLALKTSPRVVAFAGRRQIPGLLRWVRGRSSNQRWRVKGQKCGEGLKSGPLS